MRRPTSIPSFLMLLAMAPLASAQLSTSSYFDRASHVVMPQTSGFSLRHGQPAVSVEQNHEGTGALGTPNLGGGDRESRTNRRKRLGCDEPR